MGGWYPLLKFSDKNHSEQLGDVGSYKNKNRSTTKFAIRISHVNGCFFVFSGAVHVHRWPFQSRDVPVCRFGDPGAGGRGSRLGNQEPNSGSPGRTAAGQECLQGCAHVHQGTYPSSCSPFSRLALLGTRTDRRVWRLRLEFKEIVRRLSETRHYLIDYLSDYICQTALFSELHLKIIFSNRFVWNFFKVRRQFHKTFVVGINPIGYFVQQCRSGPGNTWNW